MSVCTRRTPIAAASATENGIADDSARGRRGVAGAEAGREDEREAAAE